MIQNPLTGKMIKRDGKTAKELLKLYKKKEIKLSRKTLACLKGGGQEEDAEEAAEKFKTSFNELHESVQSFIANYATFGSKDQFANFLEKRKQNPILFFNNMYGHLTILPPPINSLFKAIFAEDNDKTFQTEEFEKLLREFALLGEDRNAENNWITTKKDDLSLKNFIDTWNQVMIKRFTNDVHFLHKFNNLFYFDESNTKLEYPEIPDAKTVKTYSQLVEFVVNQIPTHLKISKGWQMGLWPIGNAWYQ